MRSPRAGEVSGSGTHSRRGGHPGAPAPPAAGTLRKTYCGSTAAVLLTYCASGASAAGSPTLLSANERSRAHSAGISSAEAAHTEESRALCPSI